MNKRVQVVETYKCLSCSFEWGITYASWDVSCPRCHEHADVTETTDDEDTN